MKNWLWGAAALLLAGATPARAEWHKASSRHFIIYSDSKPDQLRAFATRLERFDKAMRVARSMSDPEVGDGNRLTLFVVRDTGAVRDLMAGPSSGTLGFYKPRASGSVAVVPRSTRRSTLDAETVFFHEYAHHLMLADSKTPMPSWLVEGFAEFMSTAEVKPDGSVDMGLPANHRAANLLSARAYQMPIADLLSGKPAKPGGERASLYARGWLLSHYLTFAPQRSGQLQRYLDEYARGRPAIDAARTAFGDLALLEREVDRYLARQSFPALNIPANRLPIGPVEVTALSPGAAAAMPLYQRLQTRVAKRNHAEEAAEARKLAAAYPGDALVMMTLAEAEWVAGDFAAAEAAADRANGLDPKSSEALIWKGRAIFSQAEKKLPGATFAEARGWFSRANALDPENPEPLLYFYRGYLSERHKPTANAIAALHYAAELAPQDLDLAMQSALQHVRDGAPQKARPALIRIAQHPHGGERSAKAAALAASLDAGKPAP